MSKLIDFLKAKSDINFTHLWISQSTFNKLMNSIDYHFPADFPDIKKASILTDILNVLNVKVVSLPPASEIEFKDAG
jgi:hypothetical protein